MISIGGYSPLMAQIAAIGRGRYHVTQNPGSLPALMVRESQYRQPPAHRRVSFRPGVEIHNGMTRGIDFAAGPPLLGHSLAAIRPDADLILSTPDQSPLLAHWHRGQGQVASFTSSTTGGWANEWGQWGGFRTFWTQTAWSVMRTREVNAVRVEVGPVFREAQLRRVTVFAPNLRDETRPVVRIARPSELSSVTPLRVSRSGPGIWEALVPLESGFFVDARMPQDQEPTDASGAEASYDPRLRQFGVDAPQLEAWAELGGGEVLTDLSGVLLDPPSQEASRSLRVPLFVLALLLYLLGLVLLRVPERVSGKRSGRKTVAPAAEAPQKRAA